MLTFIIVLAVAAIVVFTLTKKGKIADANNNNIPDAIEKPIEVVKEAVAEVKEVVEKVKAPKAPKAQTPKTPKATTAAPKKKTTAKKEK